MDIVGDAGIGELAWCVTRTKKMPIYQHLSLNANRILPIAPAAR
jgi:hypothetical protein